MIMESEEVLKRPSFIENMSVFGVRSISDFVIYELAQTVELDFEVTENLRFPKSREFLTGRISYDC